jgi:colicin import membrane protein
MKAALEAWGASSNLFHQGFAKEADDDEIIAATMAKPGVVLQRPVGSNVPFSEHASLPTIEFLDSPLRKREKAAKPSNIGERESRKAAIAFERELERRERQRQKEEVAAAEARARRQAAMSNAETALETAKHEHEATWKKHAGLG